MKLKKVLASVMAALMVMSSTVNAFATDPIPTVPEGETTPTEEVVIEEPVVDEPEVDPVKDLFDKLMAFETYEALDAYMTDEMTEEDYVLLSQFSDEQNAALSARVAELQENEVEQLDNRTIYVNWTGVSADDVTSVTVTYRGGNSSRNVTINNGTRTATLNVGDRGLDGLSVVVNQPNGAEKTYIATIERRGGGFGQTYYEVILTEYIEGQINHTFDHLDVRIQGVKLTLLHKVINMVTDTIIESKETSIAATVVGVDSVTINGTTYSNFNSIGGGEYRQSNVAVTITPESTAVLVVDLEDENGKRYNDVSITYNREGIQYAIEHCDGYVRTHRYDGIDFDPSEGENNITLIEYDEYVIPVQKVWDDDDNRDGKRPSAVTVVLYANGAQNDTATLNEANGWKYNFTEKPSVDESGAEITYTVAEASVPSGYTHTANDVINNQQTGYIEIVNHYVPETTSVTVNKVWNDADNQDGIRPDVVVINLLANGTESRDQRVTADNNWTFTFENLPKYQNGQVITYTITEDAVPGYTAKVEGFTVTNTHEPEKTEATVVKVWDDEDNQDGKRPESLEVTLSNGTGIVGAVTLNEANGWTATVKDLPKYANGQVITYIWDEGKVEGYTAANPAVNGTVTTLTNTHAPELIDLTVTKVWNDNFNQDGARPTSITINLLADGVVKETVTLDASGEDQYGNWVYIFKGYPKYAAGKEIAYSVTEEAVEGYETTINGYEVTNKHVPETIDIEGSKTWNDANDQDGIRPDSITINLLADGKVKSSATVTEAEGEWNYTFTNLPKYQNGQEVTYSIEEVKVEGYESEVNGFNVTNTHTPEKVTVSGSKTWDDNDDQDGKRPESITIRLLADGEEIANETVTSASQWTWSFDDLPKFKAGVEIEYTITEDKVAGYESEIIGSAEDGYEVTNKHVPETIEVKGSKTWDDANNQDGIRPDSVVINLLADGEVVDEIEVKAEDEWAWSFTDLPKYEAGEEIAYSITEEVVESYESKISGSAEEGYTVTNTHTPATIDVEGSKTWEDANNQDGKRPESITIKLLANGEEKSSATVTEEDGWKWSFTNLPKYEAGEEIVYTIAEEVVEGYTTEVDGYNVINTHKPAVIEIEVTKVWEDADNQDGIRPESITINLLADGEVIETVSVSEGDKWAWTFTDLPKYAAGKEIGYTVEEVVVDGYTSTVDGYIITNTHTPAVVEATVVKVWEDANNQDGKRPTSLIVTLSDGTEVTLNEANGWTATVKDLPKYAQGNVIEYTWTEGTMPEGYTLTNTSKEGTVTTLTNSYTPEETEATVIKVWDDAEDQDGKRPESLTVTLSNGTEVTLNEENKWTATVENLPKYEAGEEIVYTWTEGTMPEGYKLSNTSVVGTVTTLTNSYTPEVTEATVLKIWDDAINQDGIRPESLKVTLSNGTEVTLSEENGWTATVKDLPKYAGGKEIVYTWTEGTMPEGYELSNTSVDGTKTILTNRHVPETTSVTVNKVWDDQAYDDLRPESITINLLADGTKIDSKTVSEADKWTHTFTDLPKYEDGVKIVYTITEEDVNGYSSSIAGSAENGFTVTNSINEFILNVNKKWIGNTGSEVEVQILRGSEVLDTVTLNANNEWKAETTIYGSMEAINVKEVKVPSNYHVSYSNISSADENGQYNVTVTNTYIEEDPEIPDEPGKKFVVKKIWVDDNEAVRPESIKVQLYKNGKAYGRAVTLSADNNWRYVWTDLPDSDKINWTVKETVVPVGYVASIEEVRSNHHYIYNTYKPVKENVNTGA